MWQLKNTAIQNIASFRRRQVLRVGLVHSRSCRGRFQSDSCRGDLGWSAGGAHWTQRLWETEGEEEKGGPLAEENQPSVGPRQVFWRVPYLFSHLPHAINELDKDRRSVLIGVILVPVAYPLRTQAGTHKQEVQCLRSNLSNSSSILNGRQIGAFSIQYIELRRNSKQEASVTHWGKLMAKTDPLLFNQHLEHNTFVIRSLNALF